jgi:hypothetical protein
MFQRRKLLSPFSSNREVGGSRIHRIAVTDLVNYTPLRQKANDLRIYCLLPKLLIQGPLKLLGAEELGQSCTSNS